MTRTNNSLRCRHVRGSHVVPGWGCCNCTAYNGYQRSNCKRCGHKPCFELESEEGGEALELRSIGHDPDLVREWMAGKRGPFAHLEQPASSSGLNYVMLRLEGIRKLQEVLDGWDALAGVVTQLEADRQARLETRPAAKRRRSNGKRKRVA